MAGMPKRRAYKPPAPSIIPPAEFRALTPGQKMEHILGVSLDDAYVIAHWDPNEADVHQLSAKVRLIEIMTKHGFRFAVEAMKDQGRDRAIDQLAKAITDRVASKSNDAAWEHCPLGSCQRHLACMYKPCRSVRGPDAQAITDRVNSDMPTTDPAYARTLVPTDAHGSAVEPGHSRDTKDLSR